MANYITIFFATWCTLKLDSGAELAINCTAAKTCGQCIQNFGCVWCADPDRVSLDRCHNEKSTTCSENFLINPKANSVTHDSSPAIKSDEKSSDERRKDEKKLKNTLSAGSTLPNIISVTPQFINITLRPNNGHPFRIKMRYHHVADYPLDIYYLMDSSNSLLMEKLTLSFGNLGAELKEKVSKITRDLQLGFGSFIEKPVQPFISYDPEKLSEPCKGCIPTYSFRNYLPLTNDTSSFSKTVKSLKLSSNLDHPESGFDGIMQSVVCHEKIGWRNKARKLLLYSTDAPFHIAGDGKLLGILKPNDGCCHLDENGYYSESANQDYPSIQHIHSKVKENAVNLIFTVPKNLKILYKKLADVIDGAFVAEKRKDANNEETIRIISEQYEKITSEIEVEDSDLPEQLRIRYYTKCLDPSGSLTQTNKCQGLKINDSVEFELHVELLACPTDSSQWNRKFHIRPRGVNEKMTVNLKMLCDCECNEDAKICEERSSKCSKKGDLEFGVCRCDGGFSGTDCSCSSVDDDDGNCREKTGAAICSGRGSCKCNKCHCDPLPTQVPFGKFCQCSNFSCPSNRGKLCSGNGVCNCNECQCDKGWTGDDCSCESEQNECRKNSLEEICSGHGDCVCNKCVCNQTERFSGQFCDKYRAGENLCGVLNDCVLCQTRQNGPCTDICKGTTKMVRDLEDLHPEENICIVSDDQNCKYRFSYKVVGREFEINVLQQPFCDFGPSSISKFVFGVISAIVLIGFLFLMAWKIFVVLRDRKEFSKFKEEQKQAMWEDGENPLYRPASMKYRNPLFEDRTDSTNKGTKRD